MSESIEHAEVINPRERIQSLLDTQHNPEFSGDDFAQFVEAVTEIVGKDTREKDYSNEPFPDLQRQWDEEAKQAGAYSSNPIPVDSSGNMEITVQRCYMFGDYEEGDDKTNDYYYRIFLHSADEAGRSEDVSFGGAQNEPVLDSLVPKGEIHYPAGEGRFYVSQLLERPIKEGRNNSPVGAKEINVITPLLPEDVRIACQKVYSFLPQH